ncbi:TetR/AcrR family transcriptional regulator [Salininema proteolyticum]|uniref:TetR family transcriptional regulator n=1 Tax=Salininema proteolyticum TaxID=1607685 RepID=A0ABV8TZG3_9ACTN
MTSSDSDQAPPSKGERTRQHILSTALDLFVERGYDGTTMRAIASEAGVSVGNAYYYFSSKEHLIQGFYEQATYRHAEAAEAAARKEKNLSGRIEAALKAWVEVARPYHRFGGQFFRFAADPNSPLSPFSDESRESRERAIGIWRGILAESKVKLPDELADVIPDAMWMHQMAIVLYWVHDRSPDQEDTVRLIRRTAPMVARAVQLSKYKILRPLVKQAEGVMRDFLFRRPVP